MGFFFFWVEGRRDVASTFITVNLKTAGVLFQVVRVLKRSRVEVTLGFD